MKEIKVAQNLFILAHVNLHVVRCILGNNHRPNLKVIFGRHLTLISPRICTE
jgi:hypothetical protein